MFIPEEIIDKVIENNDIVDVISEYVSLKRRGRNYMGLCPFHKEKTPSFNVNQDKQIYKCFGCGEGGNVISFLMKYRNLGFVDSVNLLAERANIVIPNNGGEANNEKINLKEKLYEINKEAARYFYYNLQKNSIAQKYFINRGINSEIVKKFGLGYSLEGGSRLLGYLMSKGFTSGLIEQAGLVLKSERSGYYDRFRKRVMFPVFDVKGRVIGFGGRVLDDSKPKYLNSPETLVFNKGYNLYALNLVSKYNIERKIIIVEGYMDVIALHQFGIPNVVASLGTALTREQAKLIKRYADEVIICYDSDAAGQAATLRGLDILAGVGCEVKILSIPRGKDPDEFVRAEGKEAFAECVNNAEPLIEYKIRRKSENFDISSTEGKIGFIKASSQVLSEIDDPVSVDAYVSKLCNKTGISQQALYEEIKRQKSIKGNEQDDSDRHISGKNRYNNNIDGQKLYLEPAYIKAEKFILCILYEMREYFNSVVKRLSCEDFNDLVYRKVACIMYEKIINNDEINPSSIISLFSSQEDMKKVSEIFYSNLSVEKENIIKMIDDYVTLINKSKLINKKDSIILKLREHEEKGDVQQSAQLLKEIMEIEKQLRIY